MRKIKITIDQLGTPKVEAEGFNGVGCEDATRGIEQALSGGAVAARDYKTEYHGVEDTNTEQNYMKY